MTKRNRKYILDKENKTKIHTKTGEEIPRYKLVSNNLTTYSPYRSEAETRINRTEKKRRKETNA